MYISTDLHVIASIRIGMASCDHKAKTAEIQGLRTRVFAYADKGFDSTEDFFVRSHSVRDRIQSVFLIGLRVG